MSECEATKIRTSSRVRSLAVSGTTRKVDAATIEISLRLCQAYFAATMLAGLVFAFAIPPAALAYDLSLVYALTQMVVSALSIWFIEKRAWMARPFAAVGTALSCSLWAFDLMAFGAYETLVLNIGEGLAALAITVQFAAASATVAYMALAPSASRTLSRTLDRVATGAGHSWDVPMRQRVRSWSFWRDLLIYFIVFSFLGHWAEMWFCYNIYLGVFMGDYDFSQVMLWSQWLFPYTAEGVAIIAIALILHPVKLALLKRTGGRVLPAFLGSIVVTALVCTTIDFTCGMIANQDYSLWDYRHLPFNFMGQICLQNSIVYTIAATAIVWVFYPLMDGALRRMPRTYADALFVSLLAVYAFCALLHFMYLTPEGLVIGV